jgi:hypothetical protein
VLSGRYFQTADLDDTSPASTDAFTTAVTSRLGSPILSEAALRMGV